MNNQDIAINWVESFKDRNIVILSDQFFAPFSKHERVKLREKLIQRGYFVWPLGETKNGVSIVHKDNPYITIKRQDGFAAGTYQKDDQLMLLGFAHFPDTIGKM